MSLIYVCVCVLTVMVKFGQLRIDSFRMSAINGSQELTKINVSLMVPPIFAGAQATLVNGVEMVRRICGKMKRLKPSR